MSGLFSFLSKGVNRFSRVIRTGAFAAVLLSAGALWAGTYYNYESDGRAVRMWLPDNLDAVKGVFIYGNGAGGDSRGDTANLRYQTFCEMFDFALIGTSQYANLTGSEYLIWEKQLNQLALLSGRPELNHAPLTPIGFSNGGQMSWGYNVLYPEKTLGFETNKGAYYAPITDEASFLNPGVLVAGETDTSVRRTNVRNMFLNGHSNGALWCWVEEEGTAHAKGRTDEIYLPFMAEAIALRYPLDQTPTATRGIRMLPLNRQDGWRVDQTTWKSGLTYIAPYDEYVGNLNDDGWVMNAPIAYVYRAFSTYNKKIALSSSRATVARHVAPLTMTLTVNASSFPTWTKIEFFDGADLLQEVTSDGTGPASVAINVTLQAGVHGLSAVATNLAGEQTCSHPLAFVVLEPTPFVNAGNGQTIYFPTNAAFLNARVGDASGPQPPAGVTVQWSKLSGPGNVEFADPADVDTTAYFYALGSYVLRLTAYEGQNVYSDEVMVTVAPEEGSEPTGPYLDSLPDKLPDGRYGWTIFLRTPDQALLPYRVTIAFQGIEGATLSQMDAFGVVPIHKQSDAMTFHGLGVPPYDRTLDTWAFSPFGENPYLGVNPLTGATFNGFDVYANTFAISLSSGSGSAMGDGVPLAYIVCNGQVSWTGQIQRDGVDYDVSGQTEFPPIPGDGNGDGVVDLADYTVWADQYGLRSLPGIYAGDYNGDGSVDLADYTVWADHFGETN